MASTTGDHLVYEEIEDLDLTGVTETGETVTPEELWGRIFHIADRDEPGGYVVRNRRQRGNYHPLSPPGVVLLGARDGAARGCCRTRVARRSGRWERAVGRLQLW